jgi:hypothetical protein
MLSVGGSKFRSVTERHPDAVAPVEFRLLDQRSLPVGRAWLAAIAITDLADASK